MSNVVATKWAFTICGGITILLALGFLFWRWNALRTWPTTTATVLSSKVDHSTDTDNGDTYEAKVQIRYTAAGREYLKEVSEWGSSSNRARHYQVAERYRPGSQHSIRYLPSNPNRVFLEAGYSLWYFAPALFGLGLGILFLGLGLFLFRLRLPR
jgi:hypothetical protein